MSFCSWHKAKFVTLVPLDSTLFVMVAILVTETEMLVESQNAKICPYGDESQFLHKRDRVECESLNTDEDYEGGIFQKMKLCNMWKKFGNFPHGVKCIFAHGNAELKKISSHAIPYMAGYTSSKLKLQTSQSTDAAAPSKITFETTHKVQPESKRPFMKWNIVRISRVYADWMDNADSLPAL